MPRPPRIDFPFAWHHVMNRGARREPVFLTPAHHRLFLEQVGLAVEMTGIEVHAYALMPNHYHLLVRSPRATLSAGMKRLGAGFTQRMNWEHDWDGPMFRGRFRSLLVLDERHLLELVAYLHLNPVRSGLVEHPCRSPWTSHRAYVGLSAPPDWLSMDAVRSAFGGVAPLAEYVEGRIPSRGDLPDASPPADPAELAERPFLAPAIRAREPSATPSPSAVLAVVADLAQVSPESLRVARRGPRANPARRLAVWGLTQRAGLTHGQAGLELGMSAQQVAHVLRRHRRGGPSTELPGLKALKDWVFKTPAARP